MCVLRKQNRTLFWLTFLLIIYSSLILLCGNLVHRGEQNTATYELQLAGVMIADYTTFAYQRRYDICMGNTLVCFVGSGCHVADSVTECILSANTTGHNSSHWIALSENTTQVPNYIQNHTKWNVLEVWYQHKHISTNHNWWQFTSIHMYSWVQQYLPYT